MPKSHSEKFVIRSGISIKRKLNGFFNATFVTIILGIFIGVFGVILLGYSEGIEAEANIVKRLDLKSPQEIENELNSKFTQQFRKISNRVKVSSLPKPLMPFPARNSNKEFIYIKKVHQESRDSLLNIQKETAATEEISSNDNKNSKWIDVSITENISSFFMGDILVNPQNADLIFDLEEKDRIEAENGETRDIIYAVPIDENLIVIGDINENKVIEDGDIFIITNKTNKDLVKYLTKENQTEWWILKLTSLILLMIGLIAFIFPIIIFLDIVSGFGWTIALVIFIIAFTISFIFVFLTTLVIKYWWILLILISFILILFGYLSRKKSKKTVSFIP
jgi:hypothetical protein